MYNLCYGAGRLFQAGYDDSSQDLHATADGPTCRGWNILSFTDAVESRMVRKETPTWCLVRDQSHSGLTVLLSSILIC